MQDDEISCYVARPMNECTKMTVLPLSLTNPIHLRI